MPSALIPCAALISRHSLYPFTQSARELIDVSAGYPPNTLWESCDPP